MIWFGVLIAFFVACWVLADAKKRYLWKGFTHWESWTPLLWFFLVWWVLILFLPLYLWMRPDKLERHK